MGYALIVGGGEDGRYTIEIDIGEDVRTGLVEKFTAKSVEMQEKLALAVDELAGKNAVFVAALAEYEDATNDYILLLNGELEIETPEEGEDVIKRYQTATKELLPARGEYFVALSSKNAISFSAAHLNKAIAAWQAQVLTEQRQAWCADLTTNAAGYVATLEIPGESELMLIAPAGRGPMLATDGYLRSRGLMSPPQAYFNACILPGWQKFKPTYRWGTATAIDYDADTMSVNLNDSKSSAQGLSVNQADELAGVPVQYMTCNADAFEVGDRVVVEFHGQDWESPRVVGFLDNPKECIPWPTVLMPALARLVVTAGGVPTRFFFCSFEDPDAFSCDPRFTSNFSTPITASLPPTTSMPIQSVEVYYGSAIIIGGGGLFDISVSDVPDPIIIGTQNYFAPVGVALGTLAASPGPYPGSGEASGHQIENSSPQKLIRWSIPLENTSISEFEYIDEENKCSMVTSATHGKFSNIPFGLPFDQSSDLLSGQLGVDYVSSKFAKTTVYDDEFYKLLPDPIVTVTYHSPITGEDVVAEYVRGPTGAFRKKPPT